MYGRLNFVGCGPLNHQWNSDNQICIYPSIYHGAKPSENDPFIQEVRWGTSMTSDEFMRRLTKTSHDIFVSLQKIKSPERYLSFSMQYRAALAMCSQEIFQFLKVSKVTDEARAMHLAAQAGLVQVFELLWHLAEIVFIQVSPSGHLAYNLCTWFHLQSQEAANNAREIIRETNRTRNQSDLLQDSKLDAFSYPERHEKFWPSVLGLVLQARSHEAASLLVLHTNANSRGFRSLRELLAAMPLVSHSNNDRGIWTISGAFFPQAWNYWQSECDRRLSSGEFDDVGDDPESVTYVKLIVSILAGRSSIWNEPHIIDATGGSRCWFFRFVSFLYYTNQLVTVDELNSALDSWSSNVSNKVDTSVSGLDQVVNEMVISIFRLDLFSFVRISSEKLTNWWLVAHFTNLLNLIYPDLLFDIQSTDDCQPHSTKQHTEFKNENSFSGERDTTNNLKNKDNRITYNSDCVHVTMIEFFLLGYVESLSVETSLLSIALSYLDFCQSGRAYQSTILLRYGIPISTRALNWFINQAKIRGLHSTEEQLAVLANRRLLPLVMHKSNNPNYPPVSMPTCITLGWALMARDQYIINRIAELALSRDSGFLQTTSVATGHNNLQKFSTSSSEVAELAAIILGFARGSLFTESEEPTDHSLKSTRNVDQLRLSPELAFLIRYAELQQCFGGGDIEGAIDRLIDLLVTSPNSFGASHLTKSDGVTSCGSGLRVSIPLRLRLLAEVRHFLGRNCLRRDQIELLFMALIELRMELEVDFEHDKDVITVLDGLHVCLARERASVFFTDGLPQKPDLSGNELDANWDTVLH